MPRDEGPPAGPRGSTGAAAEAAVARQLQSDGWVIVARNLRVDQTELDLLARPPAPDRARLVIVEVRSRSGPRFGAPVESVGREKVIRLYRAAATLCRTGHPAVSPELLSKPPRIDLVSVRADGRGGWIVEGHLRGLAPP